MHKTACEMFKRLGYECRLAYQHICYVKHGIDEFLAVQKQIQELGWIEKETK